MHHPKTYPELNTFCVADPPKKRPFWGGLRFVEYFHEFWFNHHDSKYKWYLFQCIFPLETMIDMSESYQRILNTFNFKYFVKNATFLRFYLSIWFYWRIISMTNMFGDLPCGIGEMLEKKDCMTKLKLWVRWKIW